MPGRKHREGEALAQWETRKAEHAQRLEIARMRVKSLTGHVLLKPMEAAAMLGVTCKTLREMEARGELPLRVTFSPKVFGFRLADMEACVDARMGYKLVDGAS